MEQQPKTAPCPSCGRRDVPTGKDGKLGTHGPGPNDEFICPGSGDKGMVEAAKHLKVPSSEGGKS